MRGQHIRALSEALIKGEKVIERSEADAVSLAPQQEPTYHLWEGELANPEETVSVYCRLESGTRVSSVVEALSSLSNEWAELRLGYGTSNSCVDSCDVAVSDARSWSKDKLKKEVSKQRKAPLDLARGQMSRARIYSNADGQQYLLFCAHASAVDSAAMAFLLTEFSRRYGAIESNCDTTATKISEAVTAGLHDIHPASTENSIRTGGEPGNAELRLPYDYPRDSKQLGFSGGNVRYPSPPTSANG